MSEAGLLAERAAVPAAGASARALRRGMGLAAVWILVLGNAAGIVWLWAHGGNVHPKTTGDLLTSIARITGLLSAYMALIQVVLLARLPVLERLVGLDRLTVWHRWNGHATFDLVIAHVILSVWGYALLDHYPLGKEISTMLGGGIYPGMITATVGTGLLLAVDWFLARFRTMINVWGDAVGAAVIAGYLGAAQRQGAAGEPQAPLEADAETP